MGIGEILKGIVDKRGADLAMVCRVDSVDGLCCDVTPVDDALAPVKGVRLNAGVVAWL